MPQRGCARLGPCARIVDASVTTSEGSSTERAGHLQCPFCNSYDVQRLFVASLKIDSCECASCRARWDEDARTARSSGRGNHSSVTIHRYGR